MYNIQEIWGQAEKDAFASNLDSAGYQARIVYGCRIVKDDKTGEVVISNTGAGGDYYQEVEGESLKVFLDNGWRHGCYSVSLSNYRKKLDKIEKMIRNEMNGKRNPKQIKSYKTSRESAIIKYAEVMVKLNKIK